ncbi:MAG: D-alanyl-D-alanine carboxypeptidase family protein [Clostridia bacterium]|nr:D-alanyl-D-alanine carboxypeptidase family protein [Clostridia bacterium]
MNHQNPNRRNTNQTRQNPRQTRQQNPNGYPQQRQSQQNRQNPQYRQQTRQNPQNAAYRQQQYAQETPEERARREAYNRRRREQMEARRQARIDAERRERQREKELRAIERKENLKILGGRLAVFGVILLIMLVIAGGLFLWFFHRTPDETDDGGKISYTFGGEEVRKTDLADAIIEVHGEDRIYICFNDLAKYLGMAESGSAQEMKFILKTGDTAADTAAGTGNEEIITFTTDNTLVTVNGQQIQLKYPNVLRGTEVWVESGFFEDQMVNLAYTYDAKKSTVAVSRVKDEENSTDKETVYLPVSFKLKWEAAIEPIEEDPLIGDVVYNTGSDDSAGTVDLNFKNDLTEYEKYMNPEGDMRDAFLTLVNTKNTLTAADVPNDLMDCKHTSTAKATQQLREYACKALEALYIEMKANEFYNMAVYSGYRTYEYQATLFETYTQREMANNPSLSREQAEAVVLTYSTRPGTSEHQTGLAVDMDTMGTFTTDFAYTAEYAWLQENAWKFGFILRFPADKTEITTIQFEPWHYRYVGRYHAQKIHASGLCLEEYVEQLGN